MRITQADNLTPLTPQTYHILLALADRPLHGYGIMEQIEADSMGSIYISSGSLYKSLKKLSSIELIKPAGTLAGQRSPHQQKQYQLTSFGRQILKLEVQRLSHSARLAKNRKIN